MQRLYAAFLLLAGMGLFAAQQTAEVEKAWDLVGKGQRTEAVTLLRDFVRREPKNADARLLLGSLLMEAGQRDESIEHLSEGVRLRPRSAEAHNALAEAYNTFGESKLARPEFLKTVELDPSFASAHVSLGAILIESGEFQPAGEHVDRAIQLLGKTPEAAYPLYLRAKLRIERREMDQAARALEQAVALRPDFSEAWSDLGECRRNLFDDAGAVKAFQRAVDLAPSNAVARTRLGAKLLDLGRAHEAVPHLREAARLDPKNQSALNALLVALRKDGQTDAAAAVKAQLAQVLREKNQADQRLLTSIELNNRGAELEKKGDVRGALEKYRAALELNPDHPGIRTNLAVALLKLGYWDEGLTQMREALHRDPGNATLQKGLEDALAQAAAARKAKSPH